MTKPLELDEETLMAYADGEAENAAEIEAALATRPMLAARVAEMRALRQTVARAFAPIADEAVPQRLSTALKPTRKIHVGPPAVIKSPPLYPFVALSVAAATLFVCIVSARTYIPAIQPREVASANNNSGVVALPPAIRPKAKSPPADATTAPIEPAPMISTPPAAVFAEAVWVQQPDAQTIERYYPRRAAARNITGKAVLNCLVVEDGSVDCVVGSEAPGDWGFGAAALEVARHFLVAEKAANGMRAADGRITIPISFAPRNCTATPSVIALSTAATPVANVVWLEKPDVRDFMTYYPRRAIERERRGQANVRCLIALDGALTNCVVRSEKPEGFGFGDAALKMAQQFRAAPHSAKGEPTAGRLVDLPISFKL